MLHVLSGADGKTTPLCPLCFNHPPFESAVKLGGHTPGAVSGMPCTTCLHPTCKHSPSQQGVLACPECSTGGAGGDEGE